MQEFIVLGYEDGSLHVYDYTRYNTQCFKKLIFTLSNHGNHGEEPLDTVEERFCDTKYKHSGPIVDIQINPVDPCTFLTASQDGSVVIWRFVTEMEDGVQIVPSPRIDTEQMIEVVMNLQPKVFKVAGHTKTYPVTGCRWLDQSSIVVSLHCGQVFIASADPTSNLPATLICKLDYNPIRCLEMVYSPTSYKQGILVGCESGDVFLLESHNEWRPSTVWRSLRESVLCMSFNIELGILSIGLQQSIQLMTVSADLEFAPLMKMTGPQDISDNVACCQTLMVEGKPLLVYSTFDGRIGVPIYL